MSSPVSRRQILCGCCTVLGTMSFSSRRVAAAAPNIVPVEFAPFHHLPFDNDYIRLVNVTIPPGRNTGYHRHVTDFAQVYMAVSAVENTPLGGTPSVVPRKVGEVLFNGFSKKPLVHQVTNVGDREFQVLGIEIPDSSPGRFTPEARPEPYKSIMDNDRVRGWRLLLQPGEVAAPMHQAAPGVRIVVQGGELIEAVQDKPEHTLNLKFADFAFQHAGPVRSIQNSGAFPIELVEFELK